MVKIINECVPIHPYHRNGKPLRRFRGVTIHETANPAPTADARRHKDYYHNLIRNNNRQYIGYHYFVDDQIAYCVAPSNEMVWHCGDGSHGNGNWETICVEMCVNQGSDLGKCRDHASFITALELYHHGLLTAIDGMADPAKGNVFQHYSWSGKNCPAILRSEGADAWTAFIQRVQIHLDEMDRANRKQNPSTGARA